MDSLRFYKVAAHFIAIVHIVIMFANTIALPVLIIYEPWYLYFPMISLLCSPLLGAQYCMFNRLENYCRYRAGMPQIYDKITHILEYWGLQ